MCNHILYGTGSRYHICYVSPKPALPRRPVACAEQPKRSKDTHRTQRTKDDPQDYQNGASDAFEHQRQKAGRVRRAGRGDPSARRQHPAKASGGNRVPARHRTPQKDGIHVYKQYTMEIVSCKDLPSLLDVILTLGPQFNYVNTASALVCYPRGLHPKIIAANQSVVPLPLVSMRHGNAAVPL